MEKNTKLLTDVDFWRAAQDLRLFQAVRYSAGPSKAHLKKSKNVFLDGLMTRATKKADVFIVNEALTAAALYGWACYSDATKVNQLLKLIFKKLTGENDDVCELAASLTALNLEWPEFSEISTVPEIIYEIASFNPKLCSKMFNQLEAARKL